MKLLLINPYFKGVTWAPTFGLGFIGTFVKKHSNWDMENIMMPVAKRLSEVTGMEKKDIIINYFLILHILHFG